MKASELLLAIVNTLSEPIRARAVEELGRILDSLMRLAGPGGQANRTELGLVRLANDGESGVGLVVSSTDSRLSIARIFMHMGA